MGIWVTSEKDFLGDRIVFFIIFGISGEGDFVKDLICCLIDFEELRIGDFLDDGEFFFIFFLVGEDFLIDEGLSLLIWIVFLSFLLINIWMFIVFFLDGIGVEFFLFICYGFFLNLWGFLYL